jgi:thioredoxin 1
MVGPIIEKIADEHPEYVIGKVNVDEEGELAKEFGVMSIPTLVVLKGGEVANRIVGSRNEAQILELLNV